MFLDGAEGKMCVRFRLPHKYGSIWFQQMRGVSRGDISPFFRILRLQSTYKEVRFLLCTNIFTSRVVNGLFARFLKNRNGNGSTMFEHWHAWTPHIILLSKTKKEPKFRSNGSHSSLTDSFAPLVSFPSLQRKRESRPVPSKTESRPFAEHCGSLMLAIGSSGEYACNNKSIWYAANIRTPKSSSFWRLAKIGSFLNLST